MGQLKKADNATAPFEIAVLDDVHVECSAGIKVARFCAALEYGTLPTSQQDLQISRPRHSSWEHSGQQSIPARLITSVTIAMMFALSKCQR